MYRLLKIIVLLTTLSFTFVLGISLSYTPATALSLMRQVEVSVASTFEFPDTVTFRNIQRHAYRTTNHNDVIETVCGEVAQTYTPARHWRYSFQRFIVKTIENPVGEHAISLPLIEGDEALFSSAQFETLWQRSCR